MGKQHSLFKDPRKNTKLWWIQKKTTYGGSMNYRKVERPFDSKKLVHAVFKARIGKSLSFSKQVVPVRQILYAVAKRYNVKLKNVVLSHDHFHVLYYAREREQHVCFLRLVAAQLGRAYNGHWRRFGAKKSIGLWAARPFTRLVSWGKKSVERVNRYFTKNRHEALGFVEYKPRHHALSEFLLAWQEQYGNTGWRNPYAIKIST